MHAKLKKICCFSCVVAFSLMISGCGEQKEEIPETKVVKAFKIEKKQKKEEPVTPDVPKVEGSSAQAINDTGKSAQNATLPEKEKPVDSAAQKPAVGDEQQPVGAEEMPAEKKEIIADPIVVDLTASEDDEEGKFYNAEGRIDPFAPLFKPTTVKVVRSSDKPKSAREARVGRLTALEKLDLSQLKLTGIMHLPTANRSMAMVEETTGKGHVIKKGTYIGVNSGRVVEIKENVVIIEEEVENYMGDIVVRKRELKLQKPLGEG